MEEPADRLNNTEMSEELALLAALQNDITTRLRPVCNGMDDATFEQLVRDIVAMKMKYGPETDLTGSLRSDLHTLLHPDSKEAT